MKKLSTYIIGSLLIAASGSDLFGANKKPAPNILQTLIHRNPNGRCRFTGREQVELTKFFRTEIDNLLVMVPPETIKELKPIAKKEYSEHRNLSVQKRDCYNAEHAPLIPLRLLESYFGTTMETIARTLPSRIGAIKQSIRRQICDCKISLPSKTQAEELSQYPEYEKYLQIKAAKKQAQQFNQKNNSRGISL